MKSLYINLINFNNKKLAGVGYFFKRIASNIDFDDVKWESFNSITILANRKINPLELFEFKPSLKVNILYLPFSENFIIRIIYEQFLLPIYLVRKRGVFFSPTPAIPLLSRVLNKQLYIIATIHDMIPFRVKDKYSFFRGIYVRFISKASARVASKIVTVSEFSKSDIIDIAKVNDAKIEIIYNFVPELVFQELKQLKPYFVTVCTIEPGKNIEVMLRGFKSFLDSDTSSTIYHYKIIGQFGWDYNSIIGTVKELGISDYVEFTGYLSDKEKNEHLRNCIGMIYLSKYEGFGIPPLEAMYFNKISIVSNCSSLPEVVGQAGIVQDPDDHDLLAINLRKMISDSDKYAINIGKQLKKFEPKSQIDKFIKCIVQFYE